MDHRLWQKACENARHASEHLDQIASANPAEHDAIARCWEDFLNRLTVAFNAIFTGGKSPLSAAVVRRIRDDRKTDPLLDYLRVARDTLHHGLDVGIGHKGEGRKLASGETVPMITFITTDEAGGNPQEHRFTRENTLVLTNVQPTLIAINEGARSVPPPKSHLGMDIEGVDPVNAGRLALSYLEERLAELESLRGI